MSSILKNLHSASRRSRTSATATLASQPSLRATILKFSRSKALVTASVVLAMTAVDTLQAQTYFNLGVSNYSEDFSTVATWTNPTTNSWSGIAAGGSATIPDATRITAQSTSFQSAVSSSGGIHRPASNIALLSTGSTNNSSSAAVDLNLNFSGRMSGNLSFNATELNNSTGDRPGTLKVYYSTNGTSWTEITGTGLPYTAINNVASSSAVSVAIPSAVNGQSQVKLRFYYYNGPSGGATGSRPKIIIDDVAVTSVSDGADTTPPTLASVTPLSPADNAVNVAIDTPLSIKFSELIAAGTGDITLYEFVDGGAGDIAVEAFTVGTSEVTLSVPADTATFTPTVDLDNNKDYYVKIPSGVFIDTATPTPFPFAGITTTTGWNFKTIAADNTAPTIVSVTPTTASSNIAPPTSLTVTFSEDVQVASSGTAKVYVKKVSDDSTAAEIEANLFGQITTSGAVATIPIPALTPLDYGVAYYVTIDAGAFEDVSANNNAFDGLSKYSDSPTNTVLSWTFSTIDVPGLTTTYAQDFSTYTSPATLPSGWSFSGGSNFASAYLGDWGTTPAVATPGGFTGNASVFGYQHNSLTNTSAAPLLQTLTLRNTTGAELTALTVGYKGRVTVPANTRIPVFTVSVAGTSQPALGYSTADPDNSLRIASISGLTIPVNATFQISWSSSYPTGAGSARQIGISDVSVSVGATIFAPTVGNLSVPAGSIGGTVATPQAEVLSDGGESLTARGFVYALTSVQATPTLETTGTTIVTDPSSITGTYSSSLTGLTAASSYSIRAYATNTTGTTYSNVVTFTTLAAPPTLVSSYAQEFNTFDSNLTLPAGWSAISSLGIQSYASAWTSTSTTGGFSGAEADPGVLGYRHTSSTGVLTVTLRMVNGTGATLNSVYVGYLGRVSDATQPRTPAWAVSVNGTPETDLNYVTSSPDKTLKGKIVTGLSIAPGAEFTITWVSDRGLNTTGNSRKIGISSVKVAIPTAPVLASASASAITSTTATLEGSVTSDGYLAITERGFVYAPTATNSDPLISGTGVIKEVDGAVTTGALSKALTGLTASTGYSFKAYATNSLGTTYSTVATFTTSAPGLGYDTWNDAIANQAANLDFDGDGISNGAEFFMGTAGNAFTVNPGISAGTVTWPRASGILITSVKVEVSTNLTSWTDASVTYPGSVSAPPSGPVTFTLPSGPTSLFIRLNVTP